MLQAHAVVDRDFELAQVDPRLFGGFAEHMGRCVYEGLYQPCHESADANGFRTDVLELVRELNMPVMRYPGGNFLSGYNWEDGVGPRDQRPRRLDLAWHSTETNQMGTDEFMTWCKLANTAPMLAVNLGTRGPDDARRLVEYCNHPGGTQLSDWRKANGYPEPHNVKLWCLGNEMDGPWQMGHKTAHEYGRTACEAARLMRWVDPSIELVACGSSGRGMGTFGDWEREVLNETFDLVDYVSIHSYFGKDHGDSASYLAKPEGMGDFIDEVVATVDHVAALHRARKRIHLSFDEWNVSNGNHEEFDSQPWQPAPHIAECIYNVEDAVVFGGLLIQLLNHCDRVKIGCLAQVVNVLGPILTHTTGPAWRQTIFYPLAQASRFGRGAVLRTKLDTPRYDCKEREGTPTLSLSPVAGDDGSLTLFAINRNQDEPLTLTLTARGCGALRPVEHSVVADDDRNAVNTQAAPERVTPQVGEAATVDGETITVNLPAESWNMVRLEAAQA